jgi:stearoyl-CoA desaturase (delta-9 desaturase)
MTTVTEDSEFAPIDGRHPIGVRCEQAPLTKRCVTLIAIIVPFCAVIAAPVLLWGWGFQWTDLVLLLSMYVLTSLGITVGYHRLFVHRSFETFTWIKFTLAMFGSMAVQGSLFRWVGQHRLHHRYSDSTADPHTPHHHGTGILALIKGFWHAHMGWFFAADPPDLDRYAKDLRASAALRVADNLFAFWVTLGLALPAIAGGIMTQSWLGFWTGLIWGGLVRVFLVHHVTWSVNSACHLWGQQPYKSGDMSRNNTVFGILAMGEGWHNTHHAFPTSARHGLRWWQLDVSYWVIRTLELLGLAWSVKLPSLEAQAKERTET